MRKIQTFKIGTTAKILFQTNDLTPAMLLEAIGHIDGSGKCCIKVGHRFMAPIEIENIQKSSNPLASSDTFLEFHRYLNIIELRGCMARQALLSV